MRSPCRPKNDVKVMPDIRMEPKVGLLHFYPGLNAEAVNRFADGLRGLVIAGTGLGHVSKDLVKGLKVLNAQGMAVVMTTQCLEGRVNLNVYDTGRDLLSAGVISGEDMLPETALVKLMWVLGRTDEPDEVRKLMQTDLRGEISERREL